MNKVIIFLAVLIALLVSASVSLFALTPNTWSSSAEFKQNINVVGKIVTGSGATETPIEGANVTAFTTTPIKSVLTNSTGDFLIPLKSGTYSFSFVKQPQYFTQFKNSFTVTDSNKALGTIRLSPGSCDDKCSIDNVCDPRCYGSSSCSVQYAETCKNRQPGWRTSTVICCSTPIITDGSQPKTQTTQGKLTVCADDIVNRRISAIYKGDPITIIINTFKPNDNCN